MASWSSFSFGAAQTIPRMPAFVSVCTVSSHSRENSEHASWVQCFRQYSDGNDALQRASVLLSFGSRLYLTLCFSRHQSGRMASYSPASGAVTAAGPDPGRVLGDDEWWD